MRDMAKPPKAQRTVPPAKRTSAERTKTRRLRTTLGLSILAAGAFAAWLAYTPLSGPSFSLAKDASLGKTALDEVTALVAFGPRPVGSPAHLKTERAIIDKLQSAGVAVDEDRFTAQTPDGTAAMNNIIGRIPGRGGPQARTIVLATHYDTKIENKFPFVGANDGGSGTGLLLALAPLLAKRGFNHNVWLVFLDGEEAFHEWTAADSLYGSRHLAAQWKTGGQASQIGALILLDMIGDRDLGILQDSNSTPWLRDLVWKTAARLGYSKYFLSTGTAMEDDHVPILAAGIPSLDLIDFDYGPSMAYWHTAQDTLDKLSAQSLAIVGEVTLESIAELDRQ
jgi:Zn-dependent M28 family amino/carboxypeptidase